MTGHVGAGEELADGSPVIEATEVIRACQQAAVTLATAESVTAGLVAATLAEVPGCSAVLRGGVVAYATDIKERVLGLPAPVLEHVVSEEVACQMAESVAGLFEATMGLATTGVAGPDWLDGQPPGTAWIAVHDRRGAGRTVSALVQVTGERAAVRAQVVRACLGLAMRAITE